MEPTTYNIGISKKQLFNLVASLGTTDKIELLDSLKESTFLNRFKKLLNELRTDELSYDEITKEVEAVRRQRFEEGKHND